MKKFAIVFLTAVACVCLTGCVHLPQTLAEQSQGYGYTPLDPLPVILTNAVADDVTNSQATLRALPDETMRLAVGEYSGNGTITYGPASMGYAGSNYVVVLDYIKYNTLSLPLYQYQDFPPNTNRFVYLPTVDPTKLGPDKIIPIYVGVGIRMTANVKVNSGNVNLGNLIAIGAAADTKVVSGTLVIQTMGISGQSVSSAIPIPSDVNGTTIANALMAVGTIKSKFCDNSGDVTIKPQVLGMYNNIGSGFDDVISPLLAKPPVLDTTLGAGAKLMQAK